MSTLDSQVWSTISKENLSSKYEKCRNITEEIYKRINITFEIKKLGTGTQSDVSEQSDQIDSNELSNETDLFACDKSDSIPSSTEAGPPVEKCININNNEEPKTVQKPVVYKRPRKRFRKRVKKRPPRPPAESDGSSDEAPLSHAGAPNILVLTKDVKPKILTQEKQKKTNAKKREPKPVEESKTEEKDIEKEKQPVLEFPKGTIEEKQKDKLKSCTICNAEYSTERGMRRHMAVAHSVDSEKTNREKAKPV